MYDELGNYNRADALDKENMRARASTLLEAGMRSIVGGGVKDQLRLRAMRMKMRLCRVKLAQRW